MAWREQGDTACRQGSPTLTTSMSVVSMIRIANALLLGSSSSYGVC